MNEWTQVVFHVDMDAFYASIEVRDDPTLAGKPVIVGGTGRRGVVATASYEARRFGVHSAMPSFRARELCPNGLFLAPRIDHYASVSAQLMEILHRYSPEVEGLSLDEAYLDMTGTERLFGPPDIAAHRIRADIREELGITASIGVASNKMIAKIASDMDKPDGLTICEPGDEQRFLAPLSVRKIFGVGPRTGELLQRYGYRTIGDLREADPPALERLIGSHARRLIAMAHGIDSRKVTSSRRRKSVGAERTYRRDLSDIDEMLVRLRPLAEEVAESLRARQMKTSGVRLKVKYADFQTVTRESQTFDPIEDSVALMIEVERLLRQLAPRRPVRLLGVTATQLLRANEGAQAPLPLPGAFEDAARRRRLERTVDELRERYGDDALSRGATPRKRRHQWGPDED